MSEIIPALLTSDIEVLKNNLEKLNGLVDWVQIDIMDNKFVPNSSIEVNDLQDLESLKNFKSEIHLMTFHPENLLDDCKKAGAKRVIFHLEAVDNPAEMIVKLDEFGFEKGVAINPNTPVEALKPYLDKVDLVLFMSVYPGFQGQSFIPEVLEKVRELKTLAPNLKTSIDGGINAGNIRDAADTGLDYLCVGSALLKGDIKENLKQLKNLIQ